MNYCLSLEKRVYVYSGSSKPSHTSSFGSKGATCNLVHLVLEFWILNGSKLGFLNSGTSGNVCVGYYIVSKTESTTNVGKITGDIDCLPSSSVVI